jgi:hypothetical protein
VRPSGFDAWATRHRWLFAFIIGSMFLMGPLIGFILRGDVPLLIIGLLGGVTLPTVWMLRLKSRERRQ